jgi:integrase/recombinase XerD
MPGPGSARAAPGIVIPGRGIVELPGAAKVSGGETAVRRRGVVMPRAGMAPNRRGEAHTRPGIAKPRLGIVTPPAVVGVPSNGFVSPKRGIVATRRPMLVPPRGESTPPCCIHEPRGGMPKPRRGTPKPQRQISIRGPSPESMIPDFKNQGRRESMIVADAMASFLFHCRYEKNLSPRTLKAYSIDLAQLRKHLSGAGVAAIEIVDKGTLRDYIRTLFEGYKEKTIKRKVATLKVLFNFLEREDVIAVNPLRKMEVRIKETRRLPRTVPLADLKRLFRHLYRAKQGCEDRDSAAYRVLVRDIAVLEMLFATGARVSEVCNLRAEDVDLRGGCVRILGKGGRERILELCDPNVLAAVKHYHDLREVEGSMHFFQNRPGSRLTDQSVRGMLRRQHRWRRAQSSRHAAHVEALRRHAPSGGGCRPQEHPAPLGTLLDRDHPDLRRGPPRGASADPRPSIPGGCSEISPSASDN